MKYSLDKRHRLRIKGTQSVLYPRGRFFLDQHNRLVYWLNEEQSWRREYRLPAKIVFKGQWRMQPDGTLELFLDENEASDRSQPLKFRCRLVGAGSGTLAFSYKAEDQRKSSQALLQFSGCWGSDEGNRLQFYLSRRKDKSLTFQSDWTVNGNQQIVCRLGSSGRSNLSEAELSGYWEIASATRLRYFLGAGSRYAIDFKAQLESATLRPKDGEIKFRVGAGFHRTAARGDQVIALFGTWKFDKRLGLSFEVDYGPRGRRNGLSVTLSRQITRRIGGEMFVRLSKDKNDRRIEGGITVPF